MKKKQGKRVLLTSIGLFWCAGVFLLSRQMALTDGLSGFLFGIGIGLILLSVLARRPQAKRR